MVNGQIPGWVMVAGNWTARECGDYASEGTHYFWATNSRHGELRQDVDLRKIAPQIDAGKVRLDFSGHIRTYATFSNGRITIEYRDGENAKALASFDLTPAGVDKWERLTEGRVVPGGTRWVRVRMTSRLHRNWWANHAYHDNLSLKLKLRE